LDLVEKNTPPGEGTPKEREGVKIGSERSKNRDKFEKVRCGSRWDGEIPNWVVKC
jgi:hypothetical protein